MNRFWIATCALLAISLMGARGCYIEVDEVTPDPPCLGGDCVPGCEAPDCKPIPMCADLEGVYFGACEKLLGFGVVGGECQPIAGCDSEGLEFFESLAGCEEVCIVADGTCEQIEQEYYDALENASYCDENADCQILWGQCTFELGGCYEAANLSLTQQTLHDLGTKYGAAGCNMGGCDCLDFSGTAVCRENRCELDWEPQPTCEDLSGVDFGACEMLMGWGVVDRQCQAISGCSSLGYRFFESQTACEAECGASDCSTNIAICEDLIGVDFGACEKLMGWGLVEGQCAPISGCDSRGCVFFETEAACEAECGAPECLTPGSICYDPIG